jgi:hypothetical protein
MLMGTSNRRVERLIRELESIVNGGYFGGIDFAQLQERIGKLVIESLEDEQHPLLEHLHELRQTIDLLCAERDVSSNRTDATAIPQAIASAPKNPAMYLFMPQPGISLPIRKYWRLQLLLHITARSSHREALSDCLEIDPDAIASYVEKARKFSTDLWSPPQHMDYLLRAISLLDFPEPPLRLEGKTLLSAGQRIRLSTQQVEFVKLLIENTGSWLKHEEFRRRGIPNPVKMLHSLNAKASLQQIALPIHSRAGAYLLADGD